MLKSIHKESYRTLCTILSERRKALKLTQYDLAKRLNRTQSFVAKVERYERRIDVIEFLDIVQALEQDPCEIIRAVELAYYKSKDGTEA